MDRSEGPDSALANPRFRPQSVSSAEETSNLAYYERRARDVQAKSAVG